MHRSSPPPPGATAPLDGVSNGDVDWLFRGKHKRNKRSDKKTAPALAAPGASNAKTTSPLPPSPRSAPTAPATAEVPLAPLALLTTTSHVPLSSLPPTAKPAEKTSKFDMFKFGRLRSLLLALATAAPSASTTQAPALAPTPPAPTDAPKRRGSVNLALLSHIHSHLLADKALSLPLSPLVLRLNLVLRSNLGLKRLLFLLISSKLKAGSLYLAPGLVVHEAPLALMLARRGLVSSQELSHLDKFPAGVGAPAPTRRRGSLVLSALLLLLLLLAKAAAPRVVLNKNPHREEMPLRELHGIRLERVVFAIDKLAYDPQQQIPLRRPRKGNVLIPEDLVAPPPRLSMGISLSDGGKLAQEPHYLDRELQLAIDSQRRAIAEADKHAHDAHIAAKRLAAEVQGMGKRGWLHRDDDLATTSHPLELEDDERVDGKAHRLEIEKPMHVHELHFGDEILAGDHDDDSGDGTVNDNDLLLETIYTRCCHLREILPIPATLKQLKGKLAPLQVLKMLNPKPTLIDVLLFADFIAITPINTVIFDNVTMTTEMLKHFLALLVNNKSVEKLSLRNVAISPDGWQLLCKFMLRNLTVKKLDISQQKIKSDTKEQCLRKNMDWGLFTRAIEVRGGIEELVMNGCKLDDATFTNLIRKAVSLNTYRLGIAGTDLNVAKCEVIAQWMVDPNCHCIGVDVAGNDMSQGQLIPLQQAFLTGKTQLVFFLLNQTQLHDADATADFLKALAHVTTLRFLDLSLIPQVFPKIIGQLERLLPQFPSLRRIHFDLNDLTSRGISAIAAILPKIPMLVYVLFLGNSKINHEAAFSLYQAVKTLRTLHTLEMDADSVPDDLAQKIAFYLMRNLDRTVNAELHDGDEELIFDGLTLMELVERLMNEAELDHRDEDPKVQKMLTNTLIKRTRAIRLDIHTQIDKLFSKRQAGTLLIESKETLLRLCLLDLSLEKVINLFEEYASSHGLLLNSVTPLGSAVDLAQLGMTTNAQLISTALAQSSTNRQQHSLPPPVITMHSLTNELMTTGPITGPRQGLHAGAAGATGSPDQLQPHYMVLDTANGQSLTIDNETGRPVLMRSASLTLVHAREQEVEEGEAHKLGVKRQSEELKLKVPILLSIPLGPQLRDAVMAGSGIELVTDLIDRIKVDDQHDDNDDDTLINSMEGKQEAHPHPAQVDEVYDKLLNEAARVRSNR